MVGLRGLLLPDSSLELRSPEVLREDSDVEGRVSATEMTTAEVGLGGLIISNCGKPVGGFLVRLSLRGGKFFLTVATG